MLVSLYRHRPGNFFKLLLIKHTYMRILPVKGVRMSKDRDAAELAWKMFEKTGSVSYYMLYKKLNGQD